MRKQFARHRNESAKRLAHDERGTRAGNALASAAVVRQAPAWVAAGGRGIGLVVEES